MLFCFVMFKVGGRRCEVDSHVGGVFGSRARHYGHAVDVCVGRVHVPDRAGLAHRTGPNDCPSIPTYRLRLCTDVFSTVDGRRTPPTPTDVVPSTECAYGGSDRPIRDNSMNAAMPTESHDFAALAKRISAWTTNSLLTLLILVAGLGFGRQVLKWWAADASASPIASDRPASPCQMLQFGDNAWSIGRRSVAGDKKAAIEQLRSACREVLETEPSTAKPPSKAKLDFLTGLTPVDQKPGKWRLYELHDAFPMAVGVATRPNSKEDRAVVWGLAMPVGDRQWTLSTFHAGISTMEGHFSKCDIPLPPGGQKVLAMSAADGRIIAFSGPDQTDQWKQFYDGWFAHTGCKPASWRQMGTTWCAKFAGQGDLVDVCFGPDGHGGLRGLLVMTPQQLR